MTTKKSKRIKPTFDIYNFFQSAYDLFNKELFNSKLPDCLLTLQREKMVMGYFSKNRWRGKESTKHEIALNPSYFVSHNSLELMQTIVHEMCHLWQAEFGKPGAKGYHNKEWAKKMESIGLIPSDTGAKGGNKTGYKMSDYAEEHGLFYKACEKFIKKGYVLPYIDRTCSIIRPNSISQIRATDSNIDLDSSNVENLLLQPTSDLFNLDLNVINEAEETRLKKKKTVYECKGCGDKAWGKSSLNLICGNCDLDFTKQEL